MIADWAGGVTYASGGEYLGGSQEQDWAYHDYVVDLAWALGGAAWDIGMLRYASADSQFASSFAEAYADLQAEQIIDQFGVTLSTSNPADDTFIDEGGYPEFLGFTTHDIGGGQTETRANFKVQLEGDGDAHNYSLLIDQDGELLGQIPVSISAAYEYPVTVEDRDGDQPLTVDWAPGGMPEGAMIIDDPATPDIGDVVRWSPPSTIDLSGGPVDREFKLIVTDGRGGEGEQSFTLTLDQVDGAGTLPEIDPIPPLSTEVGRSMSYQAAGDDEEGIVQYFLRDGADQVPSGLEIGRLTGLITWTPKPDYETEPGDPHEVIVRVIDGAGGSAETDLDISVVGPSFGNHDPEFDLTNPAPIAPDADGVLRYTAVAQDEDNDTLYFDLPYGPGDAVFETVGNTGVLRWKPKDDEFGEFDFILRVDDKRGTPDLYPFTVTVPRPNQPPVFSTGDDLGVVRLNSLSGYVIPIYAYDPFDPTPPAPGVPDDLRPVDFEVLGGLPNGFDVEKLTEVDEDFGYTLLLVGRPDASVTVGEKTISVRITDRTGDWFDHDFTLNVLPQLTPAENSAPEIKNAPEESVGVGELFSYKPVVVDTDGSSYTLDIQFEGPGRTIDEDGRVLWTPGSDLTPGETYTLTVTADDGIESDVRSWEIEVTGLPAPNTPPRILEDEHPGATVGAVYRTSFAAEDDEDNELVWRLVEKPDARAFIRQNGELVWDAPLKEHAGKTVKFVVEVSDRPAGAPDRVTLFVDVRAQNVPPEIHEFNPPYFVERNSEQTYTPDIVDPDAYPDPMLSYALYDRGTTDVPEELWLGVDELTGEITIGGQGQSTPAEPTMDPIELDLHVTDGAVTYVLPFAVTVVDPVSPELNKAPHFLNMLPKYVEIGQQDALGFVPELNEPLSEIVLSVDPTVPSVDGLSYSGGVFKWDTRGFDEGDDGEMYTVSILAVDENGTGLPSILRRSITLVKDNAPPAFAEPLPPATVDLSPGGRLELPIVADDPEGFPLSFDLSGGNVPETMRIEQTSDRTALVIWDVPPDQTLVGNSYAIDVGVEDNLQQVASSGPLSVTITIVADETAPAVALTASHDVAVLDDLVTFYVDARDDGGIKDVFLQVDNGSTSVNVPVGANFEATHRFDQAGTYTITATAIDHAGNSDESNPLTLQVFDPATIGLPSVAITGLFEPGTQTPLDGPIASLADVQFSVGYDGADPNDVSYTLELIDDTGEQVASLDAGQGEVDPATATPLTIDATAYANGVYTLRLTADTPLNDPVVDERTVHIDSGRLKTGNFAISFVDLQVPVAGIPITISRSYDSTRADQKGAFGYGWELDLSNTRVDLDFGDSDLPGTKATKPFESAVLPDGSANPNGGTRVVVTLPDGTTEGFTFYAEPIPIVGSAAQDFLPRFQPDPGVTSELVINEVYMRRSGNSATFLVGAKQYNPLQFGTSFEVHTRSGFEYVIFADTGELYSVNDRNGNTLTFTGNGIVSSAGRSIEFEYDDQNRIRAIVDPANGRIEYAYDPDTGDLVGVTNRAMETTTFEYDPERDHFLTGVVNHQGVEVLDPEFEDGRLISLGDGSDASATFSYPPASLPGGGAVEQISDANQVPTEIVRDARGNVVRRIQHSFGPNHDVDEHDVFYHITLLDYTPEPASDAEPPADLLTHESVPFTVHKSDIPGGKDQYDVLPSEVGVELVWATINRYDENGDLDATVEGVLDSDAHPGGGPLDQEIFSQATRFQYNQFGQPISITDPAGNTTTNVYDDVGEGATGNLLETVVYRYDQGQQIVDSRTTFGYEKGNLTEVSDAQGRLTSSMTYNEFGDVESSTTYSETDSGVVGTTRHFVYDAFGNQTLSYWHWDDPSIAADGDGQVGDANVDKTIVTRTFYDDEDRVKGTAQYTLDGAESFVSAEDFDSQYPGLTPDWDTSTAYNDAGQVESSTDRYGNVTQNRYDTRGNLVETRTAGKTAGGASVWIVTRTAYDANGRAIATTDPFLLTAEANEHYVDPTTEQPVATGPYDFLRVTHTIYDDLGRVKETRRLKGLEIAVSEYMPGQFTEALYTSLFDEAYDQTAGWEQDLLSRTTTEYDGAGRVRKSTEYDTTSADPLDTRLLQTFFQYDAAGRQTHVAQVFDADGDGSVTWPPDGTMFPQAGPDVLKTETKYDGVGRPRLVIDANVHSTETVYDELGRATKTVFDDHTVAETKYDQLGRREAEVRQYDPADLAGLTDQEKAAFFAARTTSYEYDLTGRLTAVVLPEVDNPAGAGRVRPRYEYVYDVYGNQVLVRDPMDDDLGVGADNKETRFTHDHLNRQTSRTLPLGVDTPADGTDFVERMFYNDAALGDIAAPLSASVGMGQLAYSVDFEGRVTEYLYDNTPTGGGRLVKKNFYAALDNGYEVTTGATLGELSANLPASPDDTVTYTHDALGRETETVFQRNLNTASPSTHTTTRQFDAEGQLTDVVASEGAIHYGYDDLGRLARTYTDQSDIEYGYDALGRLKTVTVVERAGQTISGGEQTTYAYDKVGNLDLAVLPNDVISDYEYDALNRLDVLTHYAQEDGTGDPDSHLDNDVLYRFDYEVREDGKRTGVVETGVQGTETAVDWVYDELGRLTEEWRDVGNDGGLTTAGDYIHRYGYDLASNRVSLEKDLGAADPAGFDPDEAIAYLYDANDRLLTEYKDDLTAANDDTFTVYEYDLNPDGVTPGGDWTVQSGKTVHDGSDATGPVTESHRYEFNNQGRLAKSTVTRGADVTESEYEYDDNGVRVKQTVTENGATVVTEYLIDAQNPTGYAKPIEEWLGGTLARSYAVGHMIISQADAAGAPRFFLHDGHGSTRALLDGLTPVERYAYDAFGNAIGFNAATAATTWLFAGDGQYDPASDLVNHIRRWRQGHRFLSLDPFAGNVHDPISLHKYVYANADPIGGVDPSGLVTLAGLGVSMQTLTTRYGNNAAVAFRTYKTVNQATQALTRIIRFADKAWDTVNAIRDAIDLFSIDPSDIDELAQLLRGKLVDQIRVSSPTIRVNLPNGIERKLRRVLGNYGRMPLAQEWIGSISAALVARAIGFESTSIAAGYRGIDALMKDPLTGRFVVLEAKGGANSRLSNGQMRDAWIRNGLRSLERANRGKPDHGALNEAIENRSSMWAMVVKTDLYGSTNLAVKIQTYPGVRRWGPPF